MVRKGSINTGCRSVSTYGNDDGNIIKQEKNNFFICPHRFEPDFKILKLFLIYSYGQKDWHPPCLIGQKKVSELEIIFRYYDNIGWPKIPCNSVEQEIKDLFSHSTSIYKFLLP